MRLLDKLASPGSNRTKRAVGLVALVGLIASIAVHVSTFLGADVAATMNPAIAIPLHAGLFPPFFATVYALRAELKGVDGRELMRRLMRVVPIWARVLFLVAFYYAIVNFGLFMVRSGGASVQRREGETILTECSYKYDLEFLEAVVRPAGFVIEELWTDARDWFWVGFLTPC